MTLARPDDHVLIKAAVDEIEKAGSVGDDWEMAVYPMRYEDTTALLQVLDPVLQRQAKFATDPKRDGIVVWASPENQKKIAGAIADFMVNLPKTREPVSRVYHFRNGDPQSALRVLSQIVPSARMAVNEQNRSLVVSAVEEDHEKVRSTVDEMEKTSKEGQQSVLRAHQIVTADPQKLYQMVRTFFRRRSDVDVSLDEENNTIVAMAAPVDQEKIAELVKQVEAGGTAETAENLEVYDVDNVDTVALMDVLEALLRKRQDSVRYSLDDRSEQLVVIARPREQKIVATTVEKMRTEDKELEILQLQTLDPETAETAILRLFDADGFGFDPRAPDVEIDEDNQQLFINATEEQHAKIRQLLVKMGETGLRRVTASDTKNTRVIPFGGDVNTVIEQIRKVWPELRENPVRVVDPSQLPEELKDKPAGESKAEGEPKATAEPKTKKTSSETAPEEPAKPAAEPPTTEAAPDAEPEPEPAAEEEAKPATSGVRVSSGIRLAGGGSEESAEPESTSTSASKSTSVSPTKSSPKKTASRRSTKSAPESASTKKPTTSRSTQSTAKSMPSRSQSTRSTRKPSSVRSSSGVKRTPSKKKRTSSRSRSTSWDGHMDKGHMDNGPSSDIDRPKTLVPPRFTFVANVESEPADAPSPPAAAAAAPEAESPKPDPGADVASEKPLEPVYLIPTEGGVTVKSNDPEALDRMEMLLRSIAPKPEYHGRNLEVFELKHTDAVEMADKLEDMFREMRGRRSRYSSRDQTVIMADERLNAVVVRGSKTDRSTVGSLVQILDVEQPAAEIAGLEPTLIAVKNTGADEVAQIVEDVFRAQLRARNSSRSSGRLSPSIAVNEQSNSVVVRAQEPLLGQIKDLITSLDEAAEAENARGLKLIQLKHVNAYRVQEALDSAMGRARRRAMYYGGGRSRSSRGRGR